jgi:hypothetical protein
MAPRSVPPPSRPLALHEHELGVDPDGDIGFDVRGPVPRPLPDPELHQIAAEANFHIGEAERRRDQQFALLDAAVDALQGDDNHQMAVAAFNQLAELVIDGNDQALYADDYVIWDEHGQPIGSEQDASAASSGELYSQSSSGEDSDREWIYIDVSDFDIIPLRRSARIRNQELRRQLRPMSIPLGRISDEYARRMSTRSRANSRWCRDYERRYLARGGDPLGHMTQAQRR